MPKFLAAIAITVLSFMAVSPAVAQFDGTDLGNPDSMFVEVTRYADGFGEFSIMVDLYLYNDVQDIRSVMCLLEWDNPRLKYDSLQWSPVAEFAFFTPEVFDPPDVDTVNAWQQLPFVGLPVGGALPLAGGPEPKLLVTYYMHLSSRNDENLICIDLVDSTTVGLSASDDNDYVPVWRGPVCSDQAPGDLGGRDSIYVELSQIESGEQHYVMMDVYFTNDVQALQGGVLGYTWDHPGLHYDSTVASPLGEAGFDLILTLPADTANYYTFQAFSPLVLFDIAGFPPDESPRMVGTAYFHLTSWNSGDVVCFDTASNEAITTVLVEAGNSHSYMPLWPGAVCLELLGDPTVVYESEPTGLPDMFSLSQNYPNPFNPSTSIEYSLTHSSEVIMTVMNLLGQTVATLNEGRQGPGSHSVRWNGTDDAGYHVASGIYFYRLEVDDQILTRKMLLLK